MANKAIFICDKCLSYIDIVDIHVAEIKIDRQGYGVRNPIRTVGVGKSSVDAVRREICRTCAEQLYAEFNLDKSVDILTATAFNGFALPANPNLKDSE